MRPIWSDVDDATMSGTPDLQDRPVVLTVVQRNGTKILVGVPALVGGVLLGIYIRPMLSQTQQLMLLIVLLMLGSAVVWIDRKMEAKFLEK